jgi:hypothetical protein
LNSKDELGRKLGSFCTIPTGGIFDPIILALRESVDRAASARCGTALERHVSAARKSGSFCAILTNELQLMFFT